MLSKVLSGRETARAQPAIFSTVALGSASARVEPVGAEDASEDERIHLRECVRRLEAELNTARRESFEAGMQQGEQRTRQELAPVIDRMNGSVAEVIGMRQDIRRRAEKDVVQLSLLIARRVLHRELSVDPNALNALARVVFERLARAESYQVTVHPAFAEGVRNAVPGNQLSRVQIESDPQAAPGTLTIRSSEGLIDASVDAQLAEITSGLTDHISKS